MVEIIVIGRHHIDQCHVIFFQAQETNIQLKYCGTNGCQGTGHLLFMMKAIDICIVVIGPDLDV
jgi:hypothetical protein